MHMLTMLDLDADLFADNVLAYEDPGQQYVIIQYSMVTKPNSNILIGQFQIYLFSNGDIGYIYNNVYASPESKGRNALMVSLVPAYNTCAAAGGCALGALGPATHMQQERAGWHVTCLQQQCMPLLPWALEP